MRDNTGNHTYVSQQRQGHLTTQSHPRLMIGFNFECRTGKVFEEFFFNNVILIYVNTVPVTSVSENYNLLIIQTVN